MYFCDLWLIALHADQGKYDWYIVSYRPADWYLVCGVSYRSADGTLYMVFSVHGSWTCTST